MEQPQQQPTPVPAPQQQQQQPHPNGSSSVPSDKAVVTTPIWVVAIMGVQLLLSIIILGLCAWAIHGAYLACEGFAIAVSIISWLILAYTLLSEKLPALQNQVYHVFAVLGAQLFLVILWLAAMGAVAAERAKYKHKVTVGGCYDDGSLVSSQFCTIVGKRAVLLTDRGMDGMVAIACLCALEFILFGVTFGYILKSYLAQRNTNPTTTPATMESSNEPKQMYAAPQPTSTTPAPAYQAAFAPPAQQQQYMMNQPGGMQPHYSGTTNYAPVSPMNSPPPPAAQQMHAPPPQQQQQNELPGSGSPAQGQQVYEGTQQPQQQQVYQLPAQQQQQQQYPHEMAGGTVYRAQELPGQQQQQ